MGRSRRAERRFHVISVLVLIGVLAVSVLGFVSTRSSHQDTEARLLDERMESASSVFMSSLPSLVSPLDGAAALAEETEADEEALRAFLEPQVGEAARFDSVSIWSATGTDPEPVLVVGNDPELATLAAAEVQAFFERASSSDDLAVLDLVRDEVPSLGYATTTGPGGTYVVYAENTLPPDRTNVPQEESPFRDLDYALYLGPEDDTDAVLVASKPELPFEGRTEQAEIPFGDAVLLLVLEPQGDLAGTLSSRLPWLILFIGAALAVILAALVEGLLRRRDRALRLADENRLLYDEQRTVADAVQHSLLPQKLPALEGLEVAVRYQPGVRGTEVGGDWYDVVALGEDRLLVVVGDVAGRGIEAATVMAMLRHAIRAYALQGDDPTTLPAKLTDLMRLDDDRGFATLLLLDVDLGSGTMTVVNAGHPRPLLLNGERRFVDSPVGLPVGVTGDRLQEAVRVPIEPGTTLLAFTDGLFERRGESVDEGMERLRTVVAPDQPLNAVLDALLDDLATGAEPDDVAIVGIRW